MPSNCSVNRLGSAANLPGRQLFPGCPQQIPWTRAAKPEQLFFPGSSQQVPPQKPQRESFLKKLLTP